MKRVASVLTVLCVSACGSSAAVDSGINDPQVPPLGAQAMNAWLEKGAYRQWACQATQNVMGPHGANRICSNDTLSKSPSTMAAYGANSATVKELLDGPDSGVIVGHAVMRKLSTDAGTPGNAWYFFEVIGGNVVADRAGDSSCVGCHAGAPKDFIFRQIQ